MLGKLMKYEWRSTWKVNTLLLGILAVSVLLVGVLGLIPSYNFQENFATSILIMVVLLFYGELLCCTMGVPLYLTIRYYKSMYSSEGYLTHTLPLTSGSLYLGKIVHFVIWNLITKIAACCSIGLAVLSLAYMATDREFRLMDFLEEIIESFDVWSQYPAMEGCQLFLVLFMAYMVVSIISVAVQCTGVVNVGQLFKTHRIAGAILVYVAVYIVKQAAMFAAIFRIGTISGNGISVFEIYNYIFAWSLLYEVLIDVLLFVASAWILKKKVNLE